MRKVRCERLVQGLVPSEKIASVRRADGVLEEVSIASSLTTGGAFIQAAPITREKDNVLIELPVESAAGNWRIWVSAAQVVE